MKAMAEGDNAMAERDNAMIEEGNAMTEEENAMTEEENAMTEKLVAMNERLVAITHFMTPEDAWVSAMPELVKTYGLEALSSWRDERNKHKHKLVHTAAARCFVAVLKAMAALGFDLNVQRDSDQCTPLHLAIFYKKPEAIATLKALGVDMSLENSYGESCDAKFEKLAQSMLNIVFLDLELTHGFYDADEWRRSKILEVAVVITDKDLKELGRGHWVVAGFSADELNGLAPFHQARGPPPLRTAPPSLPRDMRLHPHVRRRPSGTRSRAAPSLRCATPRATASSVTSSARPLPRSKLSSRHDPSPDDGGPMMMAPQPRRDLAATPAVSPRPPDPPAWSAHKRARAVRPRSCSHCCASTASRRRAPSRASRSSATAKCCSERCPRPTPSSTIASSTSRASRA